jgi:uncharacterized protein (DUF58 family)
VTRSPTPKLGAYAGLSGLGLLAALALGRPELVALAAPFALVLTAGLAFAREPRLSVTFEVERERALEGEELPAEFEVFSTVPVPRLELLLALPPGLEIADGEHPVALRLTPREERLLPIHLLCAHWGAYTPGTIVVRAHDALGLYRYEEELDRRAPLKVYPGAEALRSYLPPAETQVFSGNQVARVKGEGIEYADLRPFVFGDQLRGINWRASARRGSLYVNERHPERNTDVILFLDSFTEARSAAGSTLDLTVRAAAALASRYLHRKDRVGLVSFGGVLRWLLPGTGLTQLYQIVDSLLDTEIVLSYAWKDLDVIPSRTLPPKALVIALSPLLDERSVGALLDLRARGFDLAVVDVSPVPFAPAGKTVIEQLTRRLWVLRRRAARAEYERLGVPVAEWREGQSFEGAMEEVKAFRRHARLSRA